MNFTNREKELLLSNAPVLSRITLYAEDGTALQVFNEDDYLVDWEYEDYRYVPDQGFIGQFVERLLDGHLMNIPEELSLEDKEITVEIAVVDNELEEQVYHNYGRFIITKIEQEDASGSYKFESSDYAKKFNIPFANTLDYPCTALELLDNACNQANVDLNTDNTVLSISYVVGAEGLEAGNYCFLINDDYYNFTLSRDLVEKELLMLKGDKLILRSVDSNYNIIREEIPYTITDTSTYFVLSDEPFTYYDFTNNDFIIDNNQFEETDSCRTVISAVAKLAYSWARINEDNKLCLDFVNTKDVDSYDEIDTDKYYEATVTGDKVEPVNKILLGMSNVEGENIVKSQDSDIMAVKKIYGETSQETYTGKNLLNYNVQYAQGTSTTISGVTVTFNNDGSITLNGTMNANNIEITGGDNKLKLNVDNTKTYYSLVKVISGSYTKSGTVRPVIAYDCKYNSGGSTYYRNYTLPTTTNSGQLDVTGAEYITRYRIWQDSSLGNTTFNNFRIQLAVYQGDNTTEWEKYVGGVPSPNPDYPQDIVNVSGNNTIKITGKSILKQGDVISTNGSLGLNEGSTSTRNGMNLERMSDQSINVSGTTTGDPAQVVLGNGKLGTYTWNYSNGYILPQGTYKVAWELSNSSNVAILIWKYDENNTYLGSQTIKAYTNTETSGVGTLTVNGKTATCIGINANQNVTITDVNVKLMVIKDSETDYTYEPYKEQSSEIDLPEGMELCKKGDYQDYITKNTGKNVYDESSVPMENGNFNYNTGVNMDNDHRIRVRDYIPCKPNTTYTISINEPIGEIGVVYKEADRETVINGFGNNLSTKYCTFTTPNNAYYLRFRFGNSTYPKREVNDYQVQLEEGSTATEYEPYGKNEWYLKKAIGKVVLNGSENWQLSQTQTNTLRFGATNGLPNGLATDMVKTQCNMFVNGANASDNTDNEHIRSAVTAYPNYVFILINKTRLSTQDLAGFKTWLSNNKPIVYYILNTPEYQKITYQPLIDQLNALQNAGLFEGTNYITVDTLNEVPTVDITVTDLEQDSTSYSGKSFEITGHDYSNGSTINIYDNPLTYTEELRRIAINGSEKLFGLTYTPMEVQSIGHPWLTGNEYMKVTNLEDNDLFFYPFDRKINYSGILTTDLSAQSKNEVQQKYENKNNMLNRLHHTEITVDKANNQITLLSQQIEGTAQDITQLQVSNNEILQQVEHIETTEIGGLQSEISSVQQTMNTITNMFQLSGGINIIRNSAFLLSDKVWEFTDSGTNPYHTELGNSYNATLSGTTASVAEIKLRSVKVKSTSDNVTNLKTDGTTYTFNFYHKQDNNMTTTIKMYSTENNNVKAFEDIVITGQQAFTNYSRTFTPTYTNYTIEIIVTSTASVGYAYIYDMMLNSGELQSWQPASDEIYSTTLQMSRLGLQVYSVGDGTITLLGSDGLLTYETTDGRTLGRLVSSRTVEGDRTRTVTTEAVYLTRDIRQENANRWVETIVNISGSPYKVEYVESGE